MFLSAQQPDDSREVRDRGFERALSEMRRPGGPFADLDPRSKRDWIARMTPSDFKGVVLYFNALLRDRDPATHTFDGEGVMTGVMTPPPQKFKEALLEETAAALTRIARDSQLDDSQALRRIGLTAAGALNLIHPNANGNGRTGRFLSYAWDQLTCDTALDVGKLKKATTDDRYWQMCTDAQVASLLAMKHFSPRRSPSDFPRPSRTNEVIFGEFTAGEFMRRDGLAPDLAKGIATLLNDTIGVDPLFEAAVRSGVMSMELLEYQVNYPDGMQWALKAEETVSALGSNGVDLALEIYGELKALSVACFVSEMKSPKELVTSRRVRGTLPEVYEAQLLKYSEHFSPGPDRSSLR